MSINQSACEPLEWEVFLDLMSRMSYDVHLSEKESQRKKIAKYQLIIAAGCYLGVRGSDLLSLRWKDLVNKKTWSIEEGKTEKKRSLSLNPDLIKIASASYRVVDPFSMELPLICNKDCRQVLIGELNRIIKITFDKYSIKTVNPSSHTLRKTFGKRVYETMGSTEAALVLISKIFNHSSTAVTKDYIGITKVNIQNAYLSI